MGRLTSKGKLGIFHRLTEGIHYSDPINVPVTGSKYDQSFLFIDPGVWIQLWVKSSNNLKIQNMAQYPKLISIVPQFLTFENHRNI